MKSLVQITVIVLLVVAGTVHAKASTVDFEDVPEGTVAQVATSNGYNFAGDNFGAIYVTNGVACGPACVSNGTRTLLAAGALFGYSDQITMTKSGGGDFVLTGLDAGGMFTGNNPQFDAAQINFVELLGGVTEATGSISLVDGEDGVANFQTFNIGGILADTVVFTGFGGENGNNGFSLDNLIVQGSAVPEPSTVALLVSGVFGVLVFGIRKRQV